MAIPNTVTTGKDFIKSKYDDFCDRLVTWNKDVERKETEGERGKGNVH